MRGEDEKAFKELGEHLSNELQPAGELGNLLVDRIIPSYWRFLRLGRVEAGIFAWERSEELTERAERGAQGYESNEAEDLMRVISINITDKRGHEEVLSRARRMRSEQEDETTTLGRTFARDADRANAFSKLSGYETTLERQLYRAPHELARLHAARRGAAVMPPQVLDVDISGMPDVTGR